MRSDQEIIERINTLGAGLEDMDGRRTNRLIDLLPFRAAAPWLKEGVTEDQWHQVVPCAEDAKSDLAFAWQKALGHRGISASLMADVVRDWVWLLLGDDAEHQIEATPYENYGAPQLTRAAALLGIRVADADTEPARRMSRGLPCVEGCESGCGR